MIYLDNLKEYVDSKDTTGLVSIVPTYQCMDEGWFNVKLVEIYHIYDETNATNLIDAAKKEKDFFSVTKKYKNPKYNKEGEVLREGYYIIKLTYKHTYNEEN